MRKYIIFRADNGWILKYKKNQGNVLKEHYNTTFMVFGTLVELTDYISNNESE